MINKSNTKVIQKQCKRVVKLSLSDKNKLKKLFDLHGIATDFERTTNISRLTIPQVLKRQQGTERVINAMWEYYSHNASIYLPLKEKANAST
jgi:hypothetical protein